MTVAHRTRSTGMAIRLSRAGMVAVVVALAVALAIVAPPSSGAAPPPPPPTVAQISPDHGSPHGLTLVSITGSGFVQGTTSVTFDTTTVPADKVAVTPDGDLLTVATPPHAPGAVAVTVSNGDGLTSAALTYTYRPGTPVITTPVDGGTVMTVRPVFSGTGDPTDSVTVSEGGDKICTATGVDPDGTWSCTADSALAAGPHTITAQQIDSDQDQSLPSDPVTFTVQAGSGGSSSSSESSSSESSSSGSSAESSSSESSSGESTSGGPSSVGPTPSGPTGGTGRPSASIRYPVVTQGSTVPDRAVASGFRPGVDVRVTLRSTPVDLGTVVPGPDGLVQVSFSVAALAIGEHTVTFSQGGATGTATATVSFRVVAAESASGGSGDTTASSGPGRDVSSARGADGTSSGAGSLSYTGVAPWEPLGLGLVLLSAGFALSVVGTRRRGRRAH